MRPFLKKKGQRMSKKIITFFLWVIALAGGILANRLNFPLYVAIIWSLIIGGIALVYFMRVSK